MCVCLSMCVFECVCASVCVFGWLTGFPGALNSLSLKLPVKRVEREKSKEEQVKRVE